MKANIDDSNVGHGVSERVSIGFWRCCGKKESLVLTKMTKWKRAALFAEKRLALVALSGVVKVQCVCWRCQNGLAAGSFGILLDCFWKGRRGNEELLGFNAVGKHLASAGEDGVALQVRVSRLDRR